MVQLTREGISVCYEIADPMVFALRDLVCGKMEGDAKCTAGRFRQAVFAAAR